MNVKDKYLEIAKLIQENPSLEVMTLVDIHTISDDYSLPAIGCVSVEKDFVYQPDGEYLYFENYDLYDYIYYMYSIDYFFEFSTWKKKMEEDGVLYDNSITNKKIENRIEELKKSGEIKEYIIVRIEEIKNGTDQNKVSCKRHS